jgi:hypothetical protein
VFRTVLMITHPDYQWRLVSLVNLVYQQPRSSSSTNGVRSIRVEASKLLFHRLHRSTVTKTRKTKRTLFRNHRHMSNIPYFCTSGLYDHLYKYCAIPPLTKKAVHLIHQSSYLDILDLRRTSKQSFWHPFSDHAGCINFLMFVNC